MDNSTNGSPARATSTRNNSIDSLSPEQKQSLVQEYTAGEKIYVLLERYNITRKDFATFRKDHNLNMRYKEPSIKTPEDIKLLLSDYYSQGYKVQDIISKWKISTATLYSYVKAYAGIGDNTNGLNNPKLSNYKKKKEQKKDNL